MLRSLVGSEMCIRDRIDATAAIDTFGADFTTTVVDAVAVQPLEPVLMTCLLYTSDAADDLLCVDLGGRRIIKKKKTKHSTT